MKIRRNSHYRNWRSVWRASSRITHGEQAAGVFSAGTLLGKRKVKPMVSHAKNVLRDPSTGFSVPAFSE